MLQMEAVTTLHNLVVFYHINLIIKYLLTVQVAMST